jgi:hypothetical protein
VFVPVYSPPNVLPPAVGPFQGARDRSGTNYTQHELRFLMQLKENRDKYRESAAFPSFA